MHPKTRALKNLQDDDTLLQNVDTQLQEELLHLQCLIFSRNRPDPLKSCYTRKIKQIKIAGVRYQYFQIILCGCWALLEW